MLKVCLTTLFSFLRIHYHLELEVIRTINPQAELEDLAVRDNEIDIIAKKLGIDPYAIRESKDKPTFGRRVLHEQEAELMKHICENLGLPREYWDTVAGGGK